MKSIDADVALTDAQTMAARLAESAAPERFRAIVTGTLAGLALLLAIVGLHGVVSYAVTQRTREIGVRLALGQRPPRSCAWSSFDTLRTVAAGAVPGVLCSRLRRPVAVVGGHGEREPGGRTGGVVAIFVTAALAAAAGPAWRASRVDPIVALRTS